MIEKSQARSLSIVQPVGAMPGPNNARKCFQYLMNLAFSLPHAVTVLS